MRRWPLLALVVMCLMTAGTVGFLGLSVVSAQYPAPIGSCTATPDSSTLLPGGLVTFRVVVLGSDGLPSAGVEGSARIDGQASPGTELLESTFRTDAEGALRCGCAQAGTWAVSS